jgi:hypothetical protein
VLFPFTWQGDLPGPSTSLGGYKTVQVTVGPTEVQVLG